MNRTEKKILSIEREVPKWSYRNIYLLMIFWIAINTLWTIKNLLNYSFLMVGQFLKSIPMFVPFGNPLHPSLIEFILYVCSMIMMWLIFTKLDVAIIKEILNLRLGKKSVGDIRICFLKPIKNFKLTTIFIKRPIFLRTGLFFLVVTGIGGYFIWYMTAPIYLYVFPYFIQHIKTLELNTPMAIILVGKPTNLLRLFMFIPLTIVCFISVLLWAEYNKYKDAFKNGFSNYVFSNRWLQQKLNNIDITKLNSNELHYPDVVLGPNSNTGELVIQYGKDRPLNNLIVGSIGTGKTASLILKLINQDLDWATRYINLFPKLYSKENYHSEQVKGLCLNGLSIIEPSNDLCKKTYKLVKAHGMTDENVFYLDPTNPNTPCINPMKGPVEKVSEQFAMVIEGLGEGSNSNYFFKQSERNHLKHYIYLLKLHKGTDDDDIAIFDTLLDMYNNSQLVRKMHVQLKDTFPNVDINSIQDRDVKNHWKIVQQIDEWFDSNLIPLRNRSGDIEKVRSGKYRGEDAYIDAQAENVKGLRNILNDIGTNKLLRRVLFGNSDFDMDRHLEYGGVLLVNTAKGELGELSNVLGKLVLLILQNAVFRRNPNVSSFHHIIVDEFPDYIYGPFREFPAQSRKYKTIVTVAAQTIAQLADKFGKTYMDTLLGTFRHKIIYGDVPYFDALEFSRIFGQKDKFEEGTQEQEISPLQDDPTLRTGSNYTNTRNPIMEPDDIIYQNAFQAAVKIVQHNKPMPVVQIDANFVSDKEMKKSKIVVNKESLKFWIEKSQEFSISEPLLIQSLTEDSENIESTTTDMDENNNWLPNDVPLKQYPKDLEQERISKGTDNIVYFPKITSHDKETALVIDELKRTFSSGEDAKTNRQLLLENKKQEEKKQNPYEDPEQTYSHYSRKKEETEKKIKKDNNFNFNQSDFMIDFGIYDADDDD